MEEIGMMKRLVILVAILLVATAASAQIKEPDDGCCDYSGDFQNPAPGVLGSVQVTEDFGGGIPGSWTVIDSGTNNSGWTITGSDSCALTANWTNGSGPAACSNTDFPGSSTISDTELITECYDYTGASNSSLAFTANYRDLSATAGDLFEVDYSTDGGSNWTNILSWNENHGTNNGTPGVDVSLDTSALDGQSGAQFRYHYYDDSGTGWNWYVVVDDHTLLSDGTISDGGSCTGGGDGGDGGGVPATTGIGVAALVLLMGGGSAYFLRRKN
jgi:hypothetical protein